MNLNKEVFLRSHVVEASPRAPLISNYNEREWPEYALVFDTETTLDPKDQALVFGFYRVCRLQDNAYHCVEEGILHAYDLAQDYSNVIARHVRSFPSEVVHKDYDEAIHLYNRSEFIEKVFFNAVRLKALIVAFNAPWDISRLAVQYRVSNNRAWTLILSQREFNPTKLEPKWLTRKWQTTKNGHLSTHAGYYTVVIKQNGTAYKASVYTNGRLCLGSKWKATIDEAKLDGLRILSQDIAAAKQNGPVLEPNPERPCMRVTSKDSKAAFFSLTKPLRPEEWPTYKMGTKTRLICRVLDLRTLAWALFNEQHSLKSACKILRTKNQKLDHEPSGTVTKEELEYARQDVRCSVDLLNALKEEFDLHPIKLHPDKAVSPASIGKAYLKAMGIIPPNQKYAVPDEIQGIASQAYFGGRAECKIRNTAVPVVLTDFSSQYPTVNSLLGNPEVLVAARLSFEDATEEVRTLLADITLEDCFKQDTWKQFKFFALMRPDDDVLPVRAEYSDDGVTKNIAINRLTDHEPTWFSGPDVIGSKLLSGKVPKIERAIRLTPHGQQQGLRSTNLRGMVEVDPRRDDLFCRMVEQKQVHKKSDEALSYFLKICANSTSYGMFYELTPQKQVKPVKVRVFSGDHSHDQYVDTIEKPGEWYFPPIASLITGGAHLFLAMLERCITDNGGHYLFCDTDSMCIVASRTGGWVGCSNEPRIKALSWKDVRDIAGRFESLNCYDQTNVPGSILKIEKVNFDPGKQIDVFGFATSAKRYVLYRYDAKGNIIIVDAKAHGLGYLYPPKDAVEGDPESDWVLQGWHWVLEGEIATPRPAPEWFKLPVMMRMTVSTPAVLGLLKGFTRPFNFVHVPLLFPSLYPAGKDSSNFGLIMPFSKHRSEWLKTKAIDTHSGKQYSICLLDPKGRTKKIEVKCYGNILGAYREHPEAKFLGSDGEPCNKLTRGLLRRSHIVANRHRYIGKETSRRWEQGDDLSMADFHCAEYSDGKTVADPDIRERIIEIGIRKTALATRTDSKTVMLISKGERVKPNTLAKVIGFVGKAKAS